MPSFEFVGSDFDPFAPQLQKMPAGFDPFAPPSQDQALAASMTHYPEQPNPAMPVIDALNAARRGGIPGLLQHFNVHYPGETTAQNVATFLNDPDVNMALGAMTPMKGAPPNILPRNLGPARPNRPINPQTLAEMRELQQSLPAPPVTRPINEQTLAEMRGAEAPKPDYPALLKSHGPEFANATIIDHQGNVLHNPIDRGSVGGPMLRVNEDGSVTRGILAYHGSPHDFDRFDLSKIGTGEGAQAYGYGLYFAENEGVAKEYKTKLAGGNDPMMAMAKDALSRANGDGAVAAKQLRTGMFQDRPGVAELADKLASGWKPEGMMYQVSIKADPEHFLDWDKPPSEQSEQIRQRLKSLGADPAKYSNIQTMMDDLGDPAKPGYDQAAISDKLRAAGIPGIKYLDQGSRAGGEGTRNYVVFDDKLIDIMKKYGIAGAIGAGAYHFRTQQVDHDPFAQQ